MSAVQVEQRGGRRRRVGGFFAGLLVGGSALGVAVVVVLTAGYMASRFSPPSTDDLVSVGADVSALGGAQVVVDQGARLVRQDCRGPCDDLRVTGADAVRAVRVVDAGGSCVSCRRYFLAGVQQRQERPFKRERRHP